MNTAQVMQFLADNYIAGISICCVIVLTLYLLFSIRLIITARREGMDVSASAMVPVWNLILFIRKTIRYRKNHKAYKDDEEIEL